MQERKTKTTYHRLVEARMSRLYMYIANMYCLSAILSNATLYLRWEMNLKYINKSNQVITAGILTAMRGYC